MSADCPITTTFLFWACNGARIRAIRSRIFKLSKRPMTDTQALGSGLDNLPWHAERSGELLTCEWLRSLAGQMASRRMARIDAATQGDEPTRCRGTSAGPTERAPAKYAWMVIGTTAGLAALE